MRLTASSYLDSIGDDLRLSHDVLLTPVAWTCDFLLSADDKPIVWKANGAEVFKGLRSGDAAFDLVRCQPGASMAIVTLEEIVAAGGRRVAFLGTGASVSGKGTVGSLLVDGDVVSVLDPFTEHEEWPSLAGHDAVDMEVAHLRHVAARRAIPFTDALVITDQIREDSWSGFVRDRVFEVNFEVSKGRIVTWLHDHFRIGL